MAKETCIQSISLWDYFRIHALSFVYGVWVICKRLVKWIWDPKRLNNLRLRDNPPACLVDSTLGQHKYVKVKGVKFHYVETGLRDRPLVVLLHGFPDCWLSWRYQIPILSHIFRVVCLDLKGFGDSDKPVWRSCYKIDTILEEVKLFILTLGVKKCSIIGHDLGALIGWYLVHQEPSLVTKFFAVSCPHPNVYWKSFSGTYTYQWLNFVQVPYLPELDALKEDVKLIDQYHKHLQDKDTYIEAYKYAFSRKEDWTGPINYYRNLPFHKISENSDLISSTVILITGNKDNLVKLEGVVKSTEYCEKFYMNIIDGAEHFPHHENPDNFNKVLLKYLIDKNSQKCGENIELSTSKRLMYGFLGAMSNTVKYGNSVIDNVHKRTNGVVGNMPSLGLSFNNCNQPNT